MNKNIVSLLVAAIVLLVGIALVTGANILYAPALMLAVATLILILMNNKKKKCT